MTDEAALANGLHALIRIVVREALAEVESVLSLRGATEENVINHQEVKENSSEKRLVSASIMAEYLQMPKSFIWSQTRSGKIRHYKVGRCYRYDLKEVAEALRAVVPEP